MHERTAIDARLDGRMLREVLRERLTRLATDVDRARRDSGFREALDTMRRFWRYSPFNQFVIRLQRPDATRVAARSVWESLGRRVNEGERPIGVFAPTRWRRGRGFIPVPVYDVRQTCGRRLARLDLQLRGRSRHVAALEHAAARLGIAVEYGGVREGAVAQSEGGRVRVCADLCGREKVAALAHELAHEILHQAERGRAAGAKRRPAARTRAEVETEADATAYVALGVLGIRSKAPTYIAWQGGDGAQVLRSITRVQRAAKAILEAMDSSSVPRCRSRRPTTSSLRTPRCTDSSVPTRAGPRPSRSPLPGRSKRLAAVDPRGGRLSAPVVRLNCC